MKTITLLAILLMATSVMAESQQQSTRFEQGLEPAIEQYNSLEKNLIRRVAQRLAYNGFPLEKLTRVHLQKSINSERAYYTRNKIIFIINPVVYQSADYMSTIEAITLTWQDPTVIYNDDGSMEFEIGNHIATENLVLTLYGLADEYIDRVAIENQQVILNKINALFLSCECKEVKHITANGLVELAVNHAIDISKSADSVYEVGIARIGHGVFDNKHFNEIDTRYSLKVDLDKNSVELLDKFYPSFFPTPIPMPRDNGLNE